MRVIGETTTWQGICVDVQGCTYQLGESEAKGGGHDLLMLHVRADAPPKAIGKALRLLSDTFYQRWRAEREVTDSECPQTRGTAGSGRR